jgi:sec-independent protein translocase protein TatC
VTADQFATVVQSLLDWLWTPIPGSEYPWAAVVILVVTALAVGGGVVFGIPRVRAWWNDDTIRPNEDERGVSTVEMSLIEHLIELKNRFVIVGIVVTLATVVAFVFYQQWMQIALWPLRGHELQAITPTEKVMAYFKVSFVVAIAVSMPIIVYQMWRYIAPGLTRSERRWILAFVPGASVSFIAGVAFAYFALMPAALTFLLGFGDDEIKVVPTVASYIDFVTRLLLAVGGIFQMPLIMFILTKAGVIDPSRFGSWRRYVVVIAFIVGAIVTPTPDPFNQLLIAVPVMLLFEFGALLARFA